jgi:hypothetical protein
VSLASAATLGAASADAFSLDLWSSASSGKEAVRMLAVSQATVAGLTFATLSAKDEEARNVSLLLAASHGVTAALAQLDKGKRGLSPTEANILSGVSGLQCALCLVSALRSSGGERKTSAPPPPPPPPPATVKGKGRGAKGK